MPPRPFGGTVASHSSGLIATRRGGTRHPITGKRLAGATILGATITASLAVPVAAFASPTSDDNAPLTQADWIELPEPDDVRYDDTVYDPATMEPAREGDGRAELDEWVAAGMPGYVADQGGKGVETKDPTVSDDGVGTPDDTPAHDWDGVAQCESSGDWAANTGNGYYGGLQIWEPTWIDFGGLEFASLPHLATKEQQIIVAERILAVQGKGAWPNCGDYLQDVAPVVDLTAPCTTVSFSELNLTANAVALGRAVCALFGDRLEVIGGWRAYDPYPDHPSGRAIDIMIPNYWTPEGTALADEIWFWIHDHAAEYGLNSMIHRKTYWQTDGYWYEMEDRGSDTQNHMDHIHALVN